MYWVDPLGLVGQSTQYSETALTAIRLHLIWLAKIQGDNYFTDPQNRPNRQMLSRLDRGEYTKSDFEFFSHELIEAKHCLANGAYNQPNTPEGNREALRIQAEGHNKALRIRNVRQFNLYHPNIIRGNPDIFGMGWDDFLNGK